eukprot:234523_1
MCSTFIKSIKLPITCDRYIPKPSQDPTNKNCIIISTDYEEYQTPPGIYKHNLVLNDSQIIYKYNNTFEPNGHGQCIATSNNTLILYGGCNNTFKIFDLNTNQIKQTNDKNVLSKCGFRPHNAFIPSPANQIQILDKNCNHYQYDITNKETI